MGNEGLHMSYSAAAVEEGKLYRGTITFHYGFGCDFFTWELRLGAGEPDVSVRNSWGAYMERDEWGIDFESVVYHILAERKGMGHMDIP